MTDTPEQAAYKLATASALYSRLFSAQKWARNVANSNPHPSGNFVRMIAHAFLAADDANQVILEPSMTQLRHKYPKWDIPETAD